MKLSQSSLSIIGILCAVIWLGCGNDVTIDRSLLKSTKIAFVSTREGHDGIYVMNPDGRNVVNIAKNGAYYDFPDWSPDGTKIAFVSDREGNTDIYVMNADGTNAVNITNHGAYNDSPDWSPDGTKIAFSRERGSDDDIYVMNADGTNVVKITENETYDTTPAWSGWDKDCLY